MLPALLCAVAVLAITLLVCLLMRRDQAAFNARFPPISDEEFLARCSPGTDPAIALRVRRIVADNLGIEYERIHPSARFVEDLCAD